MYTVTRQIQHPDGNKVVEVSVGGIDYCNPGALYAKYAGEFIEFDDPRSAAETAIRIASEWRKNAHSRVSVAAGNTRGMTMPFDSCTVKELRAWAKKEWKSLEKCPQCGEPLPSEQERYRANTWDGLDYCKDCAARIAEFERGF